MMRWGSGAIAAAVVLVSILVFVNRGDDTPTPVDYSLVSSEGRYLGNPDAPVDFVYYGDFQCPFCNQFHDEDFPPVVRNFVESGDVRVEWRAMPIISSMAGVPMESPANESVGAAEAAMCAADHDSFWEYGDALYDAREGENVGTFTDDMLVKTAESLDLDAESFRACLESDEKHDEVMAMYQDGIDRGVSGTPTFLIDDQLVSYSAEGYARLERQIEAALDGNLVTD